MSDFVTWASAAIITIVFLVFCKEEYKLYRIKEAIKKLLVNDNILDSLKQTSIAPIAETYSKSINIDTQDGNKSNLPASEFINEHSVCKYNKLNLRMLDTASWLNFGYSRI